MNTCAECRFWRDEVRNLLGPIYPIERPDWKECTRPNDDDNGMAVHTFTGIRADYVALITRSDFGCVQFEPHTIARQADPVIIPGKQGHRIQVIEGRAYYVNEATGERQEAGRVYGNGESFTVTTKITI